MRWVPNEETSPSSAQPGGKKQKEIGPVTRGLLASLAAPLATIVRPAGATAD